MGVVSRNDFHATSDVVFICVARFLHEGSIPARAGGTRVPPPTFFATKVYPRACGGNTLPALSIPVLDWG